MSIEEYNCVIEHEVQFRDLDALAHVNNVTIVALFEDARYAYAKRRDGFDTRGWDFILGEVRCRYHSQARLGDTLRIGIRVHWLGNSSFGFEYCVVNKADSRLVASGESVQVHFDYEAGRATRLPQEQRILLAELEGTKVEQLEGARQK